MAGWSHHIVPRISNKGGSAMRSALSLFVGLAVVLAIVVGLQAQEGKEVTKKGSLVCGKCTLKEVEKCANVLQAKEDGKTINYYLKDKGKAESYHKGICPPDSKKEATVTGVVSEDGGKKYIKASKVDVKE